MRLATAAAAGLGISPSDVFGMEEDKEDKEAAHKSKIDVLFSGSPLFEENSALGDPDADTASYALDISPGCQDPAMPMAALFKGSALPEGVGATVTVGFACTTDSPRVAEFKRLVQQLEANKVWV